MITEIVNSNNGRWRLEVIPETDAETQMIATSANRKWQVVIVGSLMMIELVEGQSASSGVRVVTYEKPPQYL
jgi:hypothetical protein